MSTRKSMSLPIIITLIMIIIVIYLFTTLQQEKVVCEKTSSYDNGISLSESVTSIVDNDSIESIHLVKTINLPDRFLKDESYKNSIQYSLKNTLEYLGNDSVKYTTTTNGVTVTIDVSKNQVVLLDNIDFDGSDDLGMEINTNTASGDVITLKVGEKYTTGDLMKKLKNNNYSCR